MINYSTILTVNYATAEWSLNANDYSSLQWYSSTPKPTQEELDALVPITADKVAKQNCKQTSKVLLQATDWATLSDVNLTNKDEFLTYRATLRNLVLNPVTSPEFPSEPTPIWSN